MAALPASDFGPVESCAFAWLAATCAGVDIDLVSPKMKNAGERDRPVRRLQIRKRDTLPGLTVACVSRGKGQKRPKNKGFGLVTGIVPMLRFEGEYYEAMFLDAEERIQGAQEAILERSLRDRAKDRIQHYCDRVRLGIEVGSDADLELFPRDAGIR